MRYGGTTRWMEVDLVLPVFSSMNEPVLPCHALSCPACRLHCTALHRTVVVDGYCTEAPVDDSVSRVGDIQACVLGG